MRKGLTAAIHKIPTIEPTTGANALVLFKGVGEGDEVELGVSTSDTGLR